MKSFLFFLLFTGFLFSPLKARQVVFLYNGNFYPFEFTNDRGNPDGAVIDLLYALARESAFELTLQSGNWAKGDDMLINGKIDLLAGYENAVENTSLVYSKPLFIVPFTLLYRQMINPSDEEGLRGSIPILSSGDSSEPLLEKRASSTDIIKTGNWSDTTEALKRGYGDYTIISTEHWKLLSGKYGDSLSPMENFNLSIPFVFTTTVWDKNLINQINDSISIIRASGEYGRIINDWFGNDDDALISQVPGSKKTGLAFLSAAALFIIIFIIIRIRKVKT